MSQFSERLERFVFLTNEKKRLAAEMASAQEQLSELEPLLLDDFAEVGCQNMNVSGLCVYKSREQSLTMIPGINRESMAEYLKVIGLGHAIQASTQSLSSYYREAKAAGTFEDNLLLYFDVNDRVRLRARKA